MNDFVLELIDALAKSINEEYSIRLGDQYEALPDEDAIVVTSRRTETDYYFIQNIQRQANNSDLPLLHCTTWSILHELGHLETEDELEDDTEKRNLLLDAPLITPEILDEYFNLPNERMATQWAIDYALDNKDFIVKFDTGLVKALLRD